MIPYCPTAGIILKWFKDEFCAPEAAEAARTAVPLYQLLDQRAAQVAPGSNGLLLLPHFAGILNPDCNPAARGVLFGIGLQTSRSHVVRAILESVGYMLRENVELLERLGMEVPEIHAMGGGAASSLWNSIKADITGKPVIVTMQEEAASLGAAMLGAVAAGWYKDIEEAWNQLEQEQRVFTPNVANRPAYDRAYRQYQRLYSSLKDFFLEAQA